MKYILFIFLILATLPIAAQPPPRDRRPRDYPPRGDYQPPKEAPKPESHTQNARLPTPATLGFGISEQPKSITGFGPSEPSKTKPESKPEPKPTKIDLPKTLKSYRFLTAWERLPKGLPSWFTDLDTNCDGQITMCEYGTEKEWTNELVAEFATHDLNNDGIVTPIECLKVIQQTSENPKSPQPPQHSAPGGPPTRA